MGGGGMLAHRRGCRGVHSRYGPGGKKCQPGVPLLPPPPLFTHTPPPPLFYPLSLFHFQQHAVARVPATRQQRTGDIHGVACAATDSAFENCIPAFCITVPIQRQAEPALRPVCANCLLHGAAASASCTCCGGKAQYSAALLGITLAVLLRMLQDGDNDDDDVPDMDALNVDDESEDEVPHQPPCRMHTRGHLHPACRTGS